MDAADYELAAMLPRLDEAGAALTTPRGSDTALLDLDGCDLLAAYASGAASPANTVAAALDRIATIDPAIGAIVTVDEAGALAAAEISAARWRAGRPRLLEGLPIVVKDLLDTAGLRTTGGSAWLADRVPSVDAAAVAAVRAAGAVVVGKSATYELGCGDQHTPFGVVANPAAPGCTTGGSSAGSAAALAARYVPLALGTDTGGSIRIPASYCGVTGLKPTLGRLPTTGIVGLAPTLDCVGPMARTPRDVALLFAALSGAPQPAPVGERDLCVGVARSWFCDVLADDVRATFEASVAALIDGGVRVVDIDVPGAAHGATLSWLITMYEAAATYRDAPRQELTAAFVSRLVVGERISAEQYRAALEARSALSAATATMFASCDVVMTPATVSTAPPLDDIDRPVAGVPSTWPDVLARTIAYWNVTGLPAVTIPVGTGDDGAPIGVQFAGPAHGDETLLAAASSLHHLMTSSVRRGVPERT